MAVGDRDLQAEAAEVRRSAMSARANMMVEQAEREEDIAQREDALRARQRSAEHAARDTAVEATKAVEASQHLEQLDKTLIRDSEAAKAAGDHARAEELWEQHLGVATDFEVARGRATRLAEEANQHAAEAAALDDPIWETQRELRKIALELQAAEKEVDKLDDKAKLLEQAHAKTVEAATNGDAWAQHEAQRLADEADAITVDEAKIEAVTEAWSPPDLEPEPTTPMSLPDDPPRVRPPKPEPDAPLPEGTDVAAEQRELDADIEALRSEATAARKAMLARVEERASELGLVRDTTAREQWAAEQAAKAAQMQVQRERREFDEAKSSAERLTREADAAAARGDHARAESLREDADTAAMERRVREARLEAAEATAKEQGDLAVSLKQDVRALEVTYDGVMEARKTAESALDNIEERARILEQAKQKFADAERNDSSRALREAQVLVDRAEKLQVERDAIRQLVPDFPVDTPGIGDADLGFAAPDGTGAAATSDSGEQHASPEPSAIGDEEIDRDVSVATATSGDALDDGSAGVADADPVPANDFTAAIAAADGLSDQFGTFFDDGADVASVATDGLGSSTPFEDPAPVAAFDDHAGTFPTEPDPASTAEPAPAGDLFDA